MNVGTMPHWIAASADGDTAYVTNEVSNDLSIVDVEQRKVIATVPVGNAPRKIVLQPGMMMQAMTTPATARRARTRDERQQHHHSEFRLRAAIDDRRARPDGDMDE